MSLSLAYIHATNQFSALRAELEVQKQAAIDEASAYGGSFAPTEIERGHELEETFLNQRLNNSSSAAIGAGQESGQGLIKLSGKDASKLIPNISMPHQAAQRIGYEQGRAYRDAQNVTPAEEQLVQKA